MSVPCVLLSGQATHRLLSSSQWYISTSVLNPLFISSLFCVSQRAFHPGTQKAYIVEHVLPFCEGFSISVAQVRRDTIDLSATPLSTRSAQAKTGTALRCLTCD